MKSERLKKLEAELKDLEQWMALGLVPKKEINRYQEEILQLKSKIEEEKTRLQVLKENGEIEEYVTPRRSPAKTVYPESPSISDLDFNDQSETDVDISSRETIEIDLDDDEREDTSEIDAYDDEDPFSDRNRWKRGGIIDPENDEW